MKGEFKDKKVLIVGMARSGLAAADALIADGAVITCQDSKDDCLSDADVKRLQDGGATICLGARPADMSVFDAVVVSPGVPTGLAFIKEAVEGGAELIGELELAYRLGKGTYIAITGTNGKTTTTTLVGEIFKASGRKTEVVGNIGTAVCAKAMDAAEDEWLVTETSSFQLETINTFRPHVSAILNLTPDHLDRHKTFENYIDAKARVFENQIAEDYVVLNADDERTIKLAERSSATVVPFSRISEPEFGAFVKYGNIVIKDKDGQTIEFCRTDELKIPGTHNLENALAAAAIAYFAGIEPDVIGEVLRTFRGVEHRIEDCGTVNGVKYINDSKGTNPDAAIKALEAIGENIILIAGGYDKGSDFSEFAKHFRDHVKHVILLGATAAKIKSAAQDVGFTQTTIVKNMEDCISEAARIAEPGDSVLLSPACASWDMYENFEQRGDHFKECVAKLQAEKQQ